MTPGGVRRSEMFTDGNPWTVTKEDCELRWGSGFFCKLCGHRFKPGDTARWQFTNDTKGAGGNPLVCVSCDGPKEKIVAEMRKINDILRRFER
jgi:hypothetical protein